MQDSKATAARETRPPWGEVVHPLGQGTWHMAEDPQRTTAEIRALRLGLDLGLKLIDTAEMYADGACEELVGNAIAGRRDEVFLVSQVLPSHAARRATIAACERSLKRLGTDRLDLYLLHWRSTVPLEETLEAFAVLIQRGSIRAWGVSNFDVSDMQDLERLSGARSVTTNQVLYNVSRRGIEYDLLPWCRSRRIPVMAYSPLEQGRLLRHPEVSRIAAHYQASSAQVILAWVLRQEGVFVIPKATDPAHVRDNRAALDLLLSGDDLAALEIAFPPPAQPQPLEML